MKAIPKWLLIPPLVAALFVLGPLSMQSAAAPAWNWPDLWQMTAALLGLVLLGLVALGAGGLVPRLRQRGRPAPGAKLVTLRQTLRLSARRSVHAIEFDDRILLVGEGERGLVLLETGRVPADVGELPRELPRLRSPAPAETVRTLLQRVGRA
jgi:flagellar biogenesis protein FliO